MGRRLPDPEYLEFIDDSNAAVLLNTPRVGRYFVWLTLVLVISVIVAARTTYLDEVTASYGKVIPSKQLQIVQNLEGGILQKILVSEGDIVEQGQELLAIDALRFTADFQEREQEYNSITGEVARLTAELQSIRIADTNTTPWRSVVQIIQTEIAAHSGDRLQQQSRYETRISDLVNQLQLSAQQITQKEQEIIELNSRVRHLKKSYEIVAQELAYTEPLAEEGVVSQVDLLKLKIKSSDLLGQLESTQLLLPKIGLELKEAILKRAELALNFRAQTQNELNDLSLRLVRVGEIKNALRDRVRRTRVVSPIRGTVKQINIATIGGIIQPGMALMEIVPTDDALLIEARVAPKDIGFLQPGLAVQVKLTAYDPAKYGVLEGTLDHISADTIQDQEGQAFYLVRVRTEDSLLQEDGSRLPIIPGMRAEVDIITGKKRVLDYLMKPVLRAKQSAISEITITSQGLSQEMPEGGFQGRKQEIGE